jgi:chromatin remodeling complex protein RSC6
MPSTKQSNKKTTPAKKTTKPAPKKVVKEAPAPAPEPVQEAPATQEEQGPTLTDDFTSFLTAMSAVQKQLRELSTQFKTLQKRVNREHRELEKASKGRRRKVVDPNKPKRAPSGFAKPTGLSPELCSFLGVDLDTQMSRTEVTGKINAYVKEHDLQNPDNRKEIVPDDSLGKLLNVPSSETLTYFNLQKFMKVHYKKAGEA